MTEQAAIEVQAHRSVAPSWSPTVASRRLRTLGRVAADAGLQGPSPEPRLQDVASGRALGRRLGWYPERMAAAAKDLESAARLAAAFSGDEAHDCPAAQRQIDYYAALATQGELAAVRRFAASLPRP